MKDYEEYVEDVQQHVCEHFGKDRKKVRRVRKRQKEKDKRQSTFAKALVDKERKKTKVLSVLDEGSVITWSIRSTWK